MKRRALRAASRKANAKRNQTEGGAAGSDGDPDAVERGGPRRPRDRTRRAGRLAERVGSSHVALVRSTVSRGDAAGDRRVVGESEQLGVDDGEHIVAISEDERTDFEPRSLTERVGESSACPARPTLGSVSDSPHFCASNHARETFERRESASPTDGRAGPYVADPSPSTGFVSVRRTFTSRDGGGQPRG